MRDDDAAYPAGEPARGWGRPGALASGPLAIAWRAVVPLVLAAAILAAPVLAATPAHADDDHAITRYAVEAHIDADGVTHVNLDLDLDLGTSGGHGPYLTLPTRQRIADDPDHYRVLDYDDFEAHSSSGASDDLRVEGSSDGLELYIGDPDTEITGVHSYQLTYQVQGLVDSGAGTGGEDELYWQVIGEGFELPLGEIVVRVSATEAPLDAACWAGPFGTDAECSAVFVAADGAEFHQPALDPEQPMSVAVQFPAGAFGGAEPILEPRRTFTNTMGLSTATAVGVAGASVVGVGGVIAGVRRRGRDRQYLDLTPGLSPSGMAGVDTAQVGPRRKAPVAVQFHPPVGVRPGEMGTLADEVADPHDVTATIVDLAVRGYFRIEEYEDEQEQAQWRLIRPEQAPGFDAPDLVAYERDVLRTLFAGSARTVELAEIAGEFHAMRTQLQADLYDEVTERGWFRNPPQRVRHTWWAAGVGIVLVGVAAALVLAFTAGLWILAVPVALTGIAVLLAGSAAPARTAKGTAVLVQSLGFKTYLETAEADQLRFEENEDIFSQYLPFAIAFELTERWADVFNELAASGHQLPEPEWYSGPALASGYWIGHIGASMAAFSTASDSMVLGSSTATNGSAFSGGGFAGGGVGGGGGGSW